MSQLSIIIPCYNEELGIEQTVLELLPFCSKNDWNILVVDDGSIDKTSVILQSLKGKIKVITHSVNKGYGASLKTAIKHVDTKLIAFYDADGQHRPKDLESLFNNISDYDMLIGKRGRDSHQDWIRKPGKWLLGKVANYLTNREIPDLNCGLRVIRHSKIKDLLHLFPDGFSFSTTSSIAFMYLSHKVDYLPIKVRKRVGKSMVKQLKHGSGTILLMIRLIVLFNPLKVFLPISFWMILTGLIYEIGFGIILLWPNVKLISAASFMILTGILIFFFGLIADQISAIRLNHTVNK